VRLLHPLLQVTVARRASGPRKGLRPGVLLVRRQGLEPRTRGLRGPGEDVRDDP
jgi:hypothetical protein